MIKNWFYFGMTCLFALLLFACSKEETPEEAASRYIKAWNEQQFEKMYEQLSLQTKQVIDKQSFIDRYKVIYAGIRLTDLEVKPNFPKEKLSPKNNEVEVQYELKMNTLAGDLHFTNQFTLVKEKIEDEERWSIHWNPSMIFPQMQEGDKVRVETFRANRGEIVDRNGKGLAVNGKALSIGIVPERLPEDESSSFEKLAQLLQLSTEAIEQKRNASWVRPDTFVPITSISKEDNRLDQLLKIQGVTYLETDVRLYPLKEAAAHLIGYVQEINAEELEKLKSKGYKESDEIGKNGLEKAFENELRGKDGGRIFIVDKKGIEKHEIARQESVHGKTIKLTIDSNIQKLAYNSLKNELGSVAAIHPQTGEVYALVSSPSFDPNMFVLGMSSEQWSKLNEDPNKPFMNRFANTYAPGSVIKPITAAIALDSNAIVTKTSIDVKGLEWQKDSSWGNYYVTRVTDPGKPVDLKTAMALSDNIYFAQAALKIGEKQFLEYAQQFGFDEPIPLAYPIKKSTIANEKSFENEIQLADSGYGQGKVQMSILHTAIAYTAFINEGNVLKPLLLKSDAEKGAQIWKQNAISKETALSINDLLVQVVQDPNGTGAEAKIPGKKMAGKTGTAELKKSKEEMGKENGFFVAYDSENPELLIAMLIENVEKRGGSKLVVSKVKSLFAE